MTTQPHTPDRALAVLARQQAGVFTRRQALACGVTPWDIERRLTEGMWIMLHSGIYCAGTTKRRRETKATADLIHCGTDARFSHLTAARLQGIDVSAWSEEVWVTVPHHRRVKPRPGLVVTRTRNMPAERQIAFGFPVTPPGRTVVDLAQVLDRDQLTGILYDLTRRGVLGAEDVLAAAEGLGNRAGTGLLRVVAEEFDPSFESLLEAEAAGHFRAAGIALTPQLEIWDGWLLVARVDFADEECKLAIEIDGHGPHSTKAAQERDKRRDRKLRHLGWETVRFTTDDVRKHPGRMVREVVKLRAVLGRKRLGWAS